MHLIETEDTAMASPDKAFYKAYMQGYFAGYRDSRTDMENGINQLNIESNLLL